MADKYRLLELRETNKWSQQYVADQLGISQRAYAHYEIGTRQLPIEILIKCALLYKVPTDYILKLTDCKSLYE